MVTFGVKRLPSGMIAMRGPMLNMVHVCFSDGDDDVSFPMFVSNKMLTAFVTRLDVADRTDAVSALRHCADRYLDDPEKFARGLVASAQISLAKTAPWPKLQQYREWRITFAAESIDFDYGHERERADAEDDVYVVQGNPLIETTLRMMGYGG